MKYIILFSLVSMSAQAKTLYACRNGAGDSIQVTKLDDELVGSIIVKGDTYVCEFIRRISQKRDYSSTQTIAKSCPAAWANYLQCTAIATYPPDCKINLTQRVIRSFCP